MALPVVTKMLRVRLAVNLDKGLDGDKQLVQTVRYAVDHTKLGDSSFYSADQLEMLSDFGAAIADMMQHPLLSSTLHAEQALHDPNW